MVFLQDLSLICAQAFAQVCPTHRLHGTVMQEAAISRRRLERLRKEEAEAKKRSLRAA
jgi:hypothetical protein